MQDEGKLAKNGKARQVGSFPSSDRKGTGPQPVDKLEREKIKEESIAAKKIILKKWMR